MTTRAELPEKIETLLQDAHQENAHIAQCYGCAKMKQLRAAIREAIDEAFEEGHLKGVEHARIVSGR